MNATLTRLRDVLRRPADDSSDYDLNPDHPSPDARTMRPAAVLLGVIDAAAGPEVVLTKRSPLLRHHAGQIAFPGGKTDPGDPSPEATALREAHEEIGLHPDQVEVLGRMNPHETITGFMVTPIVARIHGPFHPVLQVEEVAEVFRVPLAHLADPARYRVERRIWQGQWRSYYVVPWGPYYIWGATARILQRLAGQMAR